MKNILRAFVMAVIGGIIGLSATHFSMDFLSPLLDDMHPAWLLILLPLSVFSAILIHEVGHVIGGAMNGFRFSFMSVFLLRIEKINGRLEVGLNRILAGLGGLAVMVPPPAVTRGDYLWFVAGGPLGSLAGVLISGVGLYFLYPDQPIGALFCAASVLLNGLTAFMTMLPIPFDDNIDTDGIQFFDLIRGGDRASRKLTMARLLHDVNSGIRPANYPEELIQSLIRTGEPDRDTLLALLFRNSAQIDRREWKDGLDTITYVIRHIDKLPPILRRMTYLQGSIIGGINGKASVAQEWLTKAGTKGWADQACVTLAKAAVAFAANHFAAISPLLDEAERQIQDVKEPGSRILYQGLIKELRKRTESVQPGSEEL